MRDLTCRQELIGLMGCPVEKNPTALLMEAAFQALDLNYHYQMLLVEPADLPAAMGGFRALHMKGTHITVPHKIAVIPYVDALSHAAKLIGAVNTIYTEKDGRLIGENTDGKGFVAALKASGFSPAGKTVTILGAGGAARAIAVELALAGGKKLYIANRTPEKGQALANLITQHTASQGEFLPWSGSLTLPAETQLVVQCTSLGLYPNVDTLPNLDFSSLTPDMTVCDIVVHPFRTVFLQQAERLGCPTLDGMGMLLEQSRISFRLWTGQEAPLDVMKQALLSTLS